MEEYPTQSYRILVLGNNAVESSQLFEKLQLSYPGNNSTQIKDARLEFYAYPDLNLFTRFHEPQIDGTIYKLIGDTTNRGVSLFIILISQSEVFSNDMKEMITEFPKDRQFKSEKYFWDHAVVLFWFEEKRINYQEEMSKYIKSEGIREVVEKAGKRYSWLSISDTKEEIKDRILSQCQIVGKIYYNIDDHNNSGNNAKSGILTVLLFVLLVIIIGLCLIVFVIPTTIVSVIIVGPFICLLLPFAYCMLHGTKIANGSSRMLLTS